MDVAAVLDAHVRKIVAIHFDARTGAPFWLERQRELRIDATKELRTFADLEILGLMDEAALGERPISDFVPISIRSRLVGAIVADTGGTTGRPKRTVFTREEFHSAFVEPFLLLANHAGFPRGAVWLFVGPSGPHVIGQAAAACATALDSHQPFAVDFDPRWFHKLPPESTGRERYLQHIIEQAMEILRSQRIEVLFTTPAMIRPLAERMSSAQRDRIRGVHYGGMKVDADILIKAQTEWFPNAVHIAGYGNSLFGVCMEAGGDATRTLHYFPLGLRHQVRLTKRGQVCMSRLDESTLIPNLLERDFGIPASPTTALRTLGFGDGVSDPGPSQESATGRELRIY